MSQQHQSQYDPGASAITRSAGCTWTTGANGIYATTGGSKHPTPDQIKALLPRSQETDPATAGWSLTDLAKAVGRYGMAFVDHGGDGWAALRRQLDSRHYVALQGDSDQFGNATCSGVYDGLHCVGINPRSKVEGGATYWWINDPICPTGRWEREVVLRRYAEKLRPSIQFGAFLQQVPLPVAPWKWTCRPLRFGVPRRFRQYIVREGRIVGGQWRFTRGMSVPCSAPQHYPGPDGGAELVRLVSDGPVNGWYVNSRFAKEEG